MSASDIYNFRKVSDDVITGGHPTADNLRNRKPGADLVQKFGRELHPAEIGRARVFGKA